MTSRDELEIAAKAALAKLFAWIVYTEIEEDPDPVEVEDAATALAGRLVQRGLAQLHADWRAVLWDRSL